MTQGRYTFAFMIWAMASALPICAAFEPLTAKVVRVKDGETTIALRETERIDVRLECIGVTKG